jgi:hypothetical protein
MKFVITGKAKRWLFNTCDCLIEVTAWDGWLWSVEVTAWGGWLWSVEVTAWDGWLWSVEATAWGGWVWSVEVTAWDGWLWSVKVTAWGGLVWSVKPIETVLRVWYIFFPFYYNCKSCLKWMEINYQKKQVLQIHVIMFKTVVVYSWLKIKLTI